MPHKRVRANGEGTIYQNSNKTYTAQITTPAGRRSFTHASQRKVRSWLTQQRRDLDTGEYIEPTNMTLESWWGKWVETYKRTTVSKSSLNTYAYSRRTLVRLFPSLLQMKLVDIETANIQAALNALHDAGLSDRTCELVLTHIRDCMNRALLDRMIRYNPAKTAAAPSTHSKARRTVKVMSDAEYDNLISEVTRPVLRTSSGQINTIDLAGKAHRDAILFILRTGVRRGEACGLKWDDIDWISCEATIQRSIDADHAESQTKTEEIGSVPLTDDIIEMLRSRQFQKHEYVFSNQDGKPIDPRNLLRTMKKLAPNYNLHTLRKTLSTRAARAGVDLKVLQEITRHKSIQVLIKYYTAASSDDKKDAAAKISSYRKSTTNTDIIDQFN